jgi:endonuclease/exonuclease/phosphatase family metal-dependent hydrolase
VLDILLWNLFHGRAVPDVPRALLPEFSAAIAGWTWDVALLQEVPPWWGPELGRAAGASARTALTSRNALLCARRWVAERRPDLIRSNGGGANVILVRGAAPLEHRVAELRRRPERRVVHGVRLPDGPWVCNVHAQVRPHTETRKDVAQAAGHARDWAAGAPVVLGGDLNVPDPEAAGLTRIPGTHGVDHVLVAGWTGSARALDRPGGLSDHAPVMARLEAAGRQDLW